MSGGKVVAWCELTPSGKIAFFDGKPMVMVGPVGNEHHTTPLVLQSDLAAAIARAEAAERDAARYRWLRSDDVEITTLFDADDEGGFTLKNGAPLDASIDAAIAAQQAEGEDRG